MVKECIKVLTFCCFLALAVKYWSLLQVSFYMNLVLATVPTGQCAFWGDLSCSTDFKVRVLGFRILCQINRGNWNIWLIRLSVVTHKKPCRTFVILYKH